MLSDPLTILAVVFFTLIVVEVLLMYLRYSAGFSPAEATTLLLFPLFVYIFSLPWVRSREYSASSLVMEVPRLLDIPLFQGENLVIGINVIGLLVPLTISLKILGQRKVPFKEAGVLVAIVAFVTYFYTWFRPDVGIVVYFFAVPAILSAAVSFMLKMMNPEINPPMLSYVGATLGVFIGADLLNLGMLMSYPWGRPVFISIGGGGVLDAIFLAGLVAIFADLLIRGQEENVFKNFLEEIRVRNLKIKD
ncbi:MAG: DUF1614 domain-containing protein [Candidatus Hadarchaeota archaeon]